MLASDVVFVDRSVKLSFGSQVASPAVLGNGARRQCGCYLGAQLDNPRPLSARAGCRWGSLYSGGRAAYAPFISDGAELNTVSVCTAETYITCL